MKKNRPAYELVVLAAKDQVSTLEGIIFKETTTIGIRRQWMERTVLPRENIEADTLFGSVKMKQVTLPDGEVRRYPEYESLKAMAENRGISIQQAREETGRL